MDHQRLKEDKLIRHPPSKAISRFPFDRIRDNSKESIKLISGMGTEFNQPLFGRARPIRSDEWLVSTPWKISASYSNYGNETISCSR